MHWKKVYSFLLKEKNVHVWLKEKKTRNDVQKGLEELCNTFLLQYLDLAH